MSTHTILWALLVLSVISAVAVSKLTARLRWQIKHELGVGVAVVVMLAMFAVSGLWIALAFSTGYWQLAAMSIATIVISFVPDGRPS